MSLMITQNSLQASIQQEMEESEASRLEKMASLESEVVALRAALHNKEEQLITLQAELSTLKEDLQGKDEMILALQTPTRLETVSYTYAINLENLRV